MFEPGCEILQKYSLHRLCRKVFSHTLSISLPQSFKGESSLHLSRISRRLTSLKVLDSATFIALSPPSPASPALSPTFLPVVHFFFFCLFMQFLLVSMKILFLETGCTTYWHLSSLSSPPSCLSLCLSQCFFLLGGGGWGRGICAKICIGPHWRTVSGQNKWGGRHH